MKTHLCLLSLLLAVNFPAWGGSYSSGTLPGAIIPDDDYIGTGDALTYMLSGGDGTITDVTLMFTLQDGAASDLSGYLRLGNETDSPSYDLTGLIQGQTLSASSPTPYSISFTTADFQSTFGGLDPNNTWTLFLSDTVNGDQTSLNNWSLDIVTVPTPEPANALLFFLGAGLIGMKFISFRRRSFSRSRPSVRSCVRKD
jgi:hypothetical protein